MRQLDDRRRFIRQQSDHFLTQLTNAAQQKDLLHPDYGRGDIAVVEICTTPPTDPDGAETSWIVFLSA